MISQIIGAVPKQAAPAAVESPSAAAAVDAGTVQRGAQAEQARPHVTRPGIYAILLPGPGGDLLRGVFEDLAPTLDRESGEFVHWVLLGDPRRTRAHGENLLLDLAQSREAMEELWQVRLGLHADARDLAASETCILTGLYGIAIDDLPVVLVVVAGQQSIPLPIRLPVAALSDVQVAKHVSQMLRKHLDPAALLADGIGEKTLQRVVNSIGDCLIELQSGPPAAQVSQMPNDLKRHAVLNLVRTGTSMVQACKRVNISRQALYKDLAFRGSLEDAQSAWETTRSQIRRGRYKKGVIETGGGEIGSAMEPPTES